MLLPVAATSATLSATSANKPTTSGEVSSAVPSSMPPRTTTSPEVIGTKLSLAMLGGQGRTGENIAKVAEIVGQFLGLAREDMEPVDAFLARVAVAIDSLPEADRLKLQAFVNRTFTKLQLNALMAALASPAGRDAITVAIAFELFREAAVDRQTQTAISSYRQVEGEPQKAPGNLTGAPMAGPPAAKAGLPMPASPPPPQIQDEAGVLPAPEASARRAAVGGAQNPAGNGEAPPGKPNTLPPLQQAPDILQLPRSQSGGVSLKAQAPDVRQFHPEGASTAQPKEPSLQRVARGHEHGANLLPVDEQQTEAKPAHRPAVGEAKWPAQGPADARQSGPDRDAGIDDAVFTVSVPGAATLKSMIAAAAADADGNDLIASLFRLAKQGDAEVDEGHRQQPTSTKIADSIAGQAGPQSEGLTEERDLARTSSIRPASMEPVRVDDGTAPTLVAVTAEMPSPVPAVREGVPFPVFQYLVHGEPEARDEQEPPSNRDDTFDEDAAGDGDASGEESGTEQSEAEGEELVSLQADEADVDGQTPDNTTSATEVEAAQEKYPQPRAQRLREAEGLGPSHRELSAADPMHQMYVRMSGGV